MVRVEIREWGKKRGNSMKTFLLLVILGLALSVACNKKQSTTHRGEITKPNPPSKMAVKPGEFSVGAGQHTITLSGCTDPTPGVTGYNVFMGTTSGGESTTPLNASPVAGCAFTITGLPGSTTYYLNAQAYCPSCTPQLSIPCAVASGATCTQKEISATTPADTQPQPNPPTGLTVETITQNQVPLMWNVPVPQAGVVVSYYKVWRCHESGCPNPPLAGTSTGNAYTDTCDYPKVCFYKVTAIVQVNGGKPISTASSNIVKAQINSAAAAFRHVSLT
jgi:hypothetical protein